MATLAQNFTILPSMTKALFLIFHGFDPSNGISKKIAYQADALRACGMEVHLSYMDETQSKRRMVDQQVIADYGSGFLSKVKKRIDFAPVVDYAREQQTAFVYIRSDNNANPFTIRMVRQLKAAGMKVVMEIPTYPYDQEYYSQGIGRQILLDRLFRRRLARHLDAIVTFSDYTKIFGQRTIRISNGIDFASVTMKRCINDTSRELNLIGVAEIHEWHGFDRVVRGLAAYYSRPRDYVVRFHVVGYFFSAELEAVFKQLISQSGVGDYVVLHGRQHGSQLDELFEQCDFGIGSLGRHRVGIDKIKTLKNREYAARGIPFVYSETDSDFDHRPYVLKVAADESPLDIGRVIDFYRSQAMTASDIRRSIADLSWTHQMQKVVNSL